MITRTDARLIRDLLWTYKRVAAISRHMTIFDPYEPVTNQPNAGHTFQIDKFVMDVSHDLHGYFAASGYREDIYDRLGSIADKYRDKDGYSTDLTAIALAERMREEIESHTRDVIARNLLEYMADSIDEALTGEIHDWYLSVHQRIVHTLSARWIGKRSLSLHADRANIPQYAGVYILINTNDLSVDYVGQSINIRKRLTGHHVYKSDQHIVMSVREDDERSRLALEAFCIKSTHARKNVAGTRSRPTIKRILPEIRLLLAIDRTSTELQQEMTQ